jgi:hypothetical protein
MPSDLSTTAIDAAAKVADRVVDDATGGAASLVTRAVRWVANRTIGKLDERLGVAESVAHNFFDHDEGAREARAAFRRFAISVGPAFDRLERMGVDTAPIRERFGIRWWSAVSCAIDHGTIERFLSAQTAGKAAFRVALDDLAQSVALTREDFPPPEEIRAGALRAYKAEMARAIFETCRALRPQHPEEARAVLVSLAGADDDVAAEIVTRCVHATRAATESMGARLRGTGALAGGPRRQAAIFADGLREFRAAAADLRAVAAGVRQKADPAGVIVELRAGWRRQVAGFISRLGPDERSALHRECRRVLPSIDPAMAAEVEAALRSVPPQPPVGDDPVAHIATGHTPAQRAEGLARLAGARAVKAARDARRDRDIEGGIVLAADLLGFDAALATMDEAFVAEGIAPQARRVRMVEGVTGEIGRLVAEIGDRPDRIHRAQRLLRAVGEGAGEAWRARIEAASETARAVALATASAAHRGRSEAATEEPSSEPGPEARTMRP